MKGKESFGRKFANEFETYAGAVLFVFMTILLFVQVVSRYVFHHSITWAEELATILFVWMIYLGVAGAVTRRKHLKIDAFVTSLSFKKRKTCLIISDIIFFIFSLYIIFPMMSLVQNFAAKEAVSSILKIPKAISYFGMPLCFVITAVRLIQDIIRLSKEEEKDLGASKPTIDMDALEREAQELKKAEEKERLAQANKGGK